MPSLRQSEKWRRGEGRGKRRGEREEERDEERDEEREEERDEEREEEEDEIIAVKCRQEVYSIQSFELIEVTKFRSNKCTNQQQQQQ